MGKELDTVVLDYGNVLTLPQRKDAIEKIRADLGCDWPTFEALYAAERPRLDGGELDLESYWERTLVTHGYEAPRERIERFAEIDRESWSAMNEVMLRWVERLRREGYRTVLLTNMPADFFHLKVAGAPWYASFDAGVISGLIGAVKPHRAIYEHLLSVIHTVPERALFLDDLEANIAGARELGLEAVLFRSPEETLPLVAREYGLPNGHEVQHELL